MKIAFVAQPIDEFVPPVERGSIAIIAYQIARRLARSHEVLVYAPRGPGQAAESRVEGMRIRRIARTGKPLHQLLDRVSDGWSLRSPFFASSLYYRAYLQRVARDAARERVDLVHWFHFSQWAPLLRRHCPEARLVLHMQGESLSQLDPRRIGAQLRHVDLVVGCSEHVTGRIRARFPELAPRVRTVHNGVDAAHFRPAPGPGADAAPRGGRLLFVGRLSPEKGVHVLLDAFRSVAEQRPEARLELVGAPGLLPYAFIVGLSDDPRVRELARFYGTTRVARMARQLRRGADAYVTHLRSLVPGGSAGRVEFAGPVPHAALPRRYREADLFVLPSLSDAFGIPVVEAMACGLPVVAARTGGIQDSVEHGRTGLLVEPGDAGALAAAAQELLADPARARSMGEAGRERAVRLFSWDRAAALLAEHYRALRGGRLAA
jgi:glycosyltransferase involved in cell wall biosynthesis